MVQELNDLKWLLIPLYPFLVIVFFGAWIRASARRSSKVVVNMSFLGMSMNVIVNDDKRCDAREELDDVRK